MIPARVAVAYSGGRDSTALLHATLRAAGPLGIAVVALHVHHGLNPSADAWLRHCRLRCQRWARSGHHLAFASERVATAPDKGDSVEGWARKARYAALRRLALANRAPLVLLAHHRRDQAETFLLQALRGSGVAGLAGMPRVVDRAGVVWARPWIAQPREAIEAYARRHRLSYVDDDSNLDERFARNRLGLKIWPALKGAFPHAEGSLAESAAWAQEAAACLAELAMSDLERVTRDDALTLDAWAALSPARRSNALRAWLRWATGVPPSAMLVKRLLSEVMTCRNGRWPLPQGELNTYRGMLTFAARSVSEPVMRSPEATLQVLKAGAYALPGWGGMLRAVATREGGVALTSLRRLDLLPRSGAEQFQAGPGRPARSLKKQFQAAGIPSAQRSGPLLYGAGRLVFVPGLGIDARALAAPGEVQVTLHWDASAALPADAAASRGPIRDS